MDTTHTSKPTWLERATLTALGGVLLAALAGVGGLAWMAAHRTGPSAAPAVRAAPAPPPPTTCYLRASGNNAVLEVTGVRAEGACREWQQWSLKDAPNRALAWSEAPPALTYADGTPVRDPVKETCRYTLGAFTYSVTDTGGMAIGTHWCQELYTRAVKAG
jgi:hypothetical protein